MADKKHEHREAIYSEGGRKVRRCQGCFEELGEVEGAAPAAPQPEPVDVGGEAKRR